MEKGLQEGMYRSGFDRMVSYVTGMRGPLDYPGKGRWYGNLYIVYVIYIEFAVAVCGLTIGVVFFKPGKSVEVRCFTGFPVASSIFCFIRRADMILKRKGYKKLMEDYLSLYDDSPELNKDVSYYAKIIRNIPRVLIFFTALPMGTLGIIPIFVALSDGMRVVPVLSEFPFDPTEYLLVFCFICLLQMTAAYTCTLRALCFENMFNMFACRQLALTRQLSRELNRILSAVKVENSGERKFQSSKQIFSSSEEAKEVVIEELKQWVKNHQKSMRF